MTAPTLAGMLARTRSPWRSVLPILGIVIVVAWILVAVFAGGLDQIALAQSPRRLEPPSAAHLFGTDALGRDVFARILVGSRISLPLPFIAVAASLLIGGFVGLIAGYLGGWLDEILLRVADIVLAFPMIILAMVVAAALGPSLDNAVIAIIVVNWPQYARVTRSLVIGVKRREFVIAGRLLGAPWWTTVVRDILPNVAGPVLVLATLDLGNATLTLAGLSFLGLGAVPPTPEWGSMASEGVQHFSNWWIGTSAGLAIFSVVLSINLIGDALRDQLDPNTRDVLTRRSRRGGRRGA